jgi:hypothetical protein
MSPRRGATISSPRLDPRESNLPWPRCHYRAKPGDRTGVADAVCSRAVDSGSSPRTPSAVTARSPAVKRHVAGVAGMPNRRIGPVRTAANTDNSKHSVIGDAAGSGRRPLELPPHQWASQLLVPGATAWRARVSAQPKKKQKNPLCPCDRPGCYVLFPIGAACQVRRFCCALCRKALRCVLEREARWRRRRRRGLRRPGRRSRARVRGP